ncbi:MULTISPECIES: hypothetical protein [unclassified Dyella]|uniref:hypothetical protein n=1 Tax=Dyella sp. ASV21 TaxID=2795114 RepID=UPI0018EB0D94|nr:MULTISPECIES: hypothetical protein [unclassified Dyella]
MFKEFGFIEALPYLCIAIGAVLGRGAGALADAEKAGLLAGAAPASKDGDPSITAAPEAATTVVDRRADAGEALLRKPVPPQRIGMARSRDDNREDFATSMVVAAATHSAVAGTLAGGSLTGALVGSALTDDDRQSRLNDQCTTAEDRDSWSDQDNDSCSSSADSDSSDDD